MSKSLHLACLLLVLPLAIASPAWSQSGTDAGWQHTIDLYLMGPKLYCLEDLVRAA